MKTEAAAQRRITPPAGPAAAATDDLADELRWRLFTARLAGWLADVAFNVSNEVEVLNDDAG